MNLDNLDDKLDLLQNNLIALMDLIAEIDDSSLDRNAKEYISRLIDITNKNVDIYEKAYNKLEPYAEELEDEEEDEDYEDENDDIIDMPKKKHR